MFIVSILRKAVSAVLSFIILLWTGIFFGTSEAEVQNVENCNLNFTVLSDVHMEGNNGNTFKVFSKILTDIKNNVKSDAIVFLGDDTMNGQIIENLLFHGFINQIKPAEKIYTVIGNHDTGNGINEYEKLSERFWSYYNNFTGENVTDKPYYYREVNGYYFVFLGSEEDNVNTSFVSQEQLQWLDGILDLNEVTGRPVFVFNHHPYNYLDSRENALELQKILTEHSNVFYLSGHTHTTKMNFENLDEDSYSINLPRCTDESDNFETNDSGLGVQIYVSDDKVQIKARRYYASQWENYDFTYDIK